MLDSLAMRFLLLPPMSPDNKLFLLDSLVMRFRRLDSFFKESRLPGIRGLSSIVVFLSFAGAFLGFFAMVLRYIPELTPAAWRHLEGDLDDDQARQILAKQISQLVDGTIPADTQLDAVAAARQAGLKEQLAPFLKKLAEMPYGERHLAVHGGNAALGEEVFQNNIALSCTRCHRVENSGGRVGPDLTVIGKEKKPEYLLESIVDPNKTIAEGFGTLILVTEDGLQHQGIVKQEAADLIHLVDADGKQSFIPKEEVIARRNGKSAMPEDLVDKITPFELRDLVAYLTSLKTPYDEASKHGE